MNIKIVSDGTSEGTKVFDSETGDIIHLVQSIKWEIDVQGDSVCTIKILRVPADIIADGRFSGWSLDEMKKSQELINE